MQPPQDPLDPSLSTSDAAEAFRQEFDMPNAILLLDAQSDGMRSHFFQTQRVAIEKGIPAFFSTFMPKSGGTFLHDQLLRLGAVEMFNHAPNPINYYQAYLIEGWLRLFSEGGTACHSHFLPTPHNLNVINRVQCKRLWVHCRDPRQVALSMYWHQLGYGQGEGAIADERRSQNDASNTRRRAILKTADKPFVMDAKADEQIKYYFILSQRWARHWLDASAAANEMSVLLTTFEEMVADPFAFQNKVLSFFECAKPLTLDMKRSDQVRFREGRTNEWQEHLSDETKDWFVKNIDMKVYETFEWSVV